MRVHLKRGGSDDFAVNWSAMSTDIGAYLESQKDLPQIQLNLDTEAEGKSHRPYLLLGRPAVSVVDAHSPSPPRSHGPAIHLCRHILKGDVVQVEVCVERTKSREET